MFAPERHQSIRQLVRKNRRLSFAELQRAIGVSPATLRRDLTELEVAGHIIRVHGGVMDPAYVRTEISLDERVLRNHGAKQVIARAAAALIPPGSTVMVDAGSTCLEAGKLLLPRKDLRIITHSIALLAASLNGQAEVICIGGGVRKVSGALVGGQALEALTRLRADFAFLSASGLDAEEGCSTTELSEAELKKSILSRARRTLLLADQSKWEKPSTVRFAEWKEFNDFITDAPLPAKLQRQLRAAGVRVHVATAS